MKMPEKTGPAEYISFCGINCPVCYRHCCYTHCTVIDIAGIDIAVIKAICRLFKTDQEIRAL